LAADGRESSGGYSSSWKHTSLNSEAVCSDRKNLGRNQIKEKNKPLTPEKAEEKPQQKPTEENPS
jgi:hypothetical protein